MSVAPRFKPAVRKKTKLRAALCGVSGSGKTYTALRLAFAIGQKIAVIDSEHGTAAKYQGLAPDGVPFEFDHLSLDSFSPSEYTAAIDEAGRAKYDVIVIDSLSHAWDGHDGALELVGKKGGNSYTAWKDVTPLHRRMLEAILRSPSHVIATMRSKTEYVLEQDSNGKQVPRKIGLAPVQRQGVEYEFDLVGDLDLSHVLTVTKSRCPQLDGAIVVKPGASFAQPLLAWLGDGDGDALPSFPRANLFISNDELAEIVRLLAAIGVDIDKEKKDLFRRYSVEEFGHLTPQQGAEYLGRLRGRAAKAKSPVTTTAAATAAATAETTATATATATATQPASTATQPTQPTPSQSDGDPAPAKSLTKSRAKKPAATEPANPPAPVDAPKAPTPAELENLAAIRGQWAAARNFTAEDLKAEWPALLQKDYSVKSARDLSPTAFQALRKFLLDEIALLETEALQAHSATVPDGPGETLQEALTASSA